MLKSINGIAPFILYNIKNISELLLKFNINIQTVKVFIIICAHI